MDQEFFVDLKETKDWIDGQVRSSALHSSLLALADDLGPRYCGTHKEAQAQDWLEARMRKTGLENVHREFFNVQVWDYERAVMELHRENGAIRQIPVVPHIGCPPADISKVEIVDIGAGSEVDFGVTKDIIPGKWVLSEVPLWPVFRKGYDGDSIQVRRAIELGAAGFIQTNPTPLAGPRVACAPHLPGRPCPIPVVGVSKEDGAFISRLFKREKVKASLQIHCHNDQVVSANLVGEINPDEKAQGCILLTAHYDGVPVGKGAVDNASGVACILEAARILAGARDRLKSKVRIVFFGAEELDRLGSRSYLETHHSELEDISFMFNVDKARRPFGLMVQGSPDLYKAVEELWAGLDRQFHVTDVKNDSSDDELFVRAGIPAIAYMGDTGELEHCYVHTHADTLDKLNLPDVRQAAAAICLTVFHLAGFPPFARLSAEELKDYLGIVTDPHYPFGM